jgi:hypothetical protein
LNMWLCRFIFCGRANEPTWTILWWLKTWLLVHLVLLGSTF